MKWEYKRLEGGRSDGGHFMSQAAELGREGWEMISYIHEPNSFGIWAMFKRPLGR